MQHYFVNAKNNEEFVLKDGDINHIKTVLKMKVKAKIVCIYNTKHYLCEISSLTPKFTVKMLEQINVNNELTVEINCVVSLIRSSKWDFLIQKLSELGVTRIIPFQDQRSVVKIEVNKAKQKVNRWNSICKEACELAKGNKITEVVDIVYDLKDLANFKSELNLVCYENEHNINIKQRLEQKYRSITLFIGPEGGIEQEEFNQLINLNFLPVSLGKRILRAETAPIFAVVAIIYAFEF